MEKMVDYFIEKMEYVHVTGFLFVVPQRTGGNSMANVLLMEPIAL